ncbi:MAG: preprotein translocase subunit SecG [Acidobacteriota bacterium]
MIYLFYTLHVIVCFFLILVVLLQQGKGADLSVFGGGSTQTAFGARSAATLLHKLTVASFVVFILTTISIAVLKGGLGSSTVIGDVAPIEATASEATGDATEDDAAPATESEALPADDGSAAAPAEAASEGDAGADEPAQ